MNKKGFTLVELLAVLVIIGLLAVTIIPVVTNNIIDSKEKTRDMQKSSIIEASKNYHADNIGTLNIDSEDDIVIPLQVLMDEGYLTDNYKDPVSGQNYDLSNSNVTIKKVDNKYDYELYLVTE